MRRSTLLASVAACFCLGLTAPLLAAESPAAGAVSQPSPAVSQPSPKDLSPSAKSDSATAPAETCLSDLRAFDGQMQKDGYWLGGSDYGFGYGYPMAMGYGATGYQNVRPAYDIRTLVASANILARHGQEQPCQDVLATTRDMYERYVAEMRSGGWPKVDAPNWRQQQIAAAQPVTGANAPFRSDELLGTEVRNPKGDALGSQSASESPACTFFLVVTSPRETFVSDEPHDDGLRQPPKVDLRDSANVRFWCQHWNVTEAELGAAIQRVGVSAPAVAFALGKEAY